MTCSNRIGIASGLAAALFLLASWTECPALQPESGAHSALRGRKKRDDRNPKPDQAQTAKTAENEGLAVVWDKKTGAPNVVRGRDLGRRGAFSGGKGLAIAGAGRYAADAVAVMDNMAKMYRIRDAANEFFAYSQEEDRLTFHHVRMQQIHEGLRVVGGNLSVHFDKQDRAYQITGRYVPDIELDTILPQISAAEAVARAQTDLVESGLPKGAPVLDPEPVVYALDDSPALAYEVVVEYPPDNGKAGRWVYWVDAANGQILSGYNDIKFVAPPAVGGTNATITGNLLTGEGGTLKSVTGQGGSDNYYYLWRPGRSWFVYNLDTTDYARRLSPSWGASDRSEMSGGHNFDLIQSYYSSVHGRNSFNNAGAYACANVHEGVNYVNAYWDGEDFHFGDGDGTDAGPLVTLDISGHEFTHAVTEYSASLIYMDESGALNESFSDIFGTLIEFYGQPDGRSSYPGKTTGAADWLMGEDAWLASTALRDMRSPGNSATVGAGNEQPSRYQGAYWYTGGGDNGGVHYNNGVQNFFFYLLAEGGTGTNDGISYTVVGIGITNAGQVAYRTLTVYCTPDTDYNNARSAWISAAQDLNPSWASSVAAAWAACGIGEVDQVSKPILRPGTCITDTNLSVTISCGTPGAAIYYTTDDSEPTEASTNYTAPLVITENTTLKAKAFKFGMTPSETAVAVYIFLGHRFYGTTMNTSPGWTTAGQWEYGRPIGRGGQFGNPDPCSGHTETNLYGYNLRGDYAAGLTNTYWLTSSAFKLHGATNVVLAFWRWLGVEARFDHAYIQVSSNGTAWTEIWHNGTQAVTDAEWVQVAYNISSFADKQPAVYVRWGMGPTDTTKQYCGWNIDDVEIWGDVVPVPSAPSNLVAAVLPSSYVCLTWMDNATNEDSFAVFRRPAAGSSWTNIADVGADVQSYTDTVAAAASVWEYRVCAYNGHGNSDFTDEALATTPDVWDADDDTDAGATALDAPASVEASHGPHTVSGTDTSDWFEVSLNDNLTYNFNSVGGSGNPAVSVLGWNGTQWVERASDDDSGGNLQFSLNYKADCGTGAYRLRVCVSAGDSAAYPLKYSRRQKCPMDFDGDGKSDLAVFRDASGKMRWQSSTGGVTSASTAGVAAWLPAAADYDGDGKTDYSWFIPSSQIWRVYPSTSNYSEQLPRVKIGGALDTPVPADFDGDGKADMALFRGANGKIWHRSSSNGVVYPSTPGNPAWLPTVGDYDGDGKADYSWFIPASKTWRIYPSSGNYAERLPRITIGASADVPVPADYDGDGKTDIAVYRRANGKIRIKYSTLGYTNQVTTAAGTAGWLPTAADYDGDGKADYSWFIPSTQVWRVYESSNAYVERPRVTFGGANDWPLITPLLGW